MIDRKIVSTIISWQSALMLIIIVAAALLIYAKALSGPFVFDDVHNIPENAHIRMGELSVARIANVINSPSPRPFANLTFALNYYLHGYDTAGYRILNIILHILNAFLIFLIVRLTLDLMGNKKKVWIAGLAALLWTVNPVHTQSVTYIVQRMNVMSAMFFMLALYLYIQGRLRQKSGKPLSQVFFMVTGLSGFLALLSKQIALTLPACLLLYEWYFFQGLDSGWIRKQLRWISVVVLLGTAIVLIYLGKAPMEKILSMYDKQDFTMGQRLLSEPGVIFLYLSLLFFPHPSRLVLDYDFPVSLSLTDPITAIFPIFGIIGLLVFAYMTAKQYRLISFAVLWFLGNLFIESSFLGLALVFEHRTYLPSVFLSAGFAWAVVEYVKFRPLLVFILSAAVFVCGYWTLQRNTIWADEISLWQDVARKSPNLARPHSNLGLAFQKAGNSDAALRALKKTIALNPDHMQAHNNIGHILREKGRPEEAISFFRKALEINPAYADAHYNLGLAFFDLGDMANAQKSFEQTLRVNPFYSKASNNLGVLLMRAGDADGATAAYKQALEVNPRYAQAYNNLGIIVNQQGDAARAITFFEKALKLEPHYTSAADRLNRVRQNLSRYGTTISELEQGLSERPDDAGLSFRLAQTYQSAGMLYKAIAQYEATLALKPDHPASLNALAMLYKSTNRLDKATSYWEALSSLEPDNATILYNLACLYSRQNNIKQAVDNLQKAIEAGYDNLDQIRSDTNLDNIRGTEFYRTRFHKQE